MEEEFCVKYKGKDYVVNKRGKIYCDETLSIDDIQHIALELLSSPSDKCLAGINVMRRAFRKNELYELPERLEKIIHAFLHSPYCQEHVLNSVLCGRIAYLPELVFGLSSIPTKLLCKIAARNPKSDFWFCSPDVVEYIAALLTADSSLTSEQIADLIQIGKDAFIGNEESPMQHMQTIDALVNAYRKKILAPYLTLGYKSIVQSYIHLTLYLGREVLNFNGNIINKVYFLSLEKKAMKDSALFERQSCIPSTTIDGIRFTAPKSIDDFKDAASQLCNCMISYIDEVADGKCNIVVGYSGKEACICLEVSSACKVVQKSGINNAPLSDAQEEIVRKYQKWLNRGECGMECRSILISLPSLVPTTMK